MRRILLILFFCYTALTHGTLQAEPIASLFQALQQGGHVIYWRHAATDRSLRDQDFSDMDRCALQRNLNDLGLEQAQIVGEAFRRHEIPIGIVYSSAFCRNRDSARIAFGRYQVIPELWNLPAAHANPLSREQLIEGLRQRLGELPAPGKNTVIVGHNLNLRAAANVAIGEGEIAVFRPMGEGRFELLGTMTPQQLH
jgi:broad specificity phosphatase PhoE